MFDFPLSQLLMATGFLLILIGFWSLLTRRNILRIIIGFSLVDTGIHIVMVAIGYREGGSASIVDSALPASLQSNALSTPFPRHWL